MSQITIRTREHLKVFIFTDTPVRYFSPKFPVNYKSNYKSRHEGERPEIPRWLRRAWMGKNLRKVKTKILRAKSLGII